MIRLIVRAIITLFLTTHATTGAQDVALRDALPPVSALQGDWNLRSVSLTQPDPSVVSALTSGTYLGPDGSRATVLVARVADEPAAAQKSQRLMVRAYDDARATFDAKAGVERELAELPVVAGCVDMRRAIGVDHAIPDIAVGLSLCAANPNTLILTYVSGSLNGLSGYEASDAFVELVLISAAEATPVALTADMPD